MRFFHVTRLARSLNAAEVAQQGQGVHISRNRAYQLLQECSKRQDLEGSKRVQSLMLLRGLDSVSVLGDHLIRLFFAHGCLCEANQAFNKVVKPSVYTWNAIIEAHAKLGQAEMAFEMYYEMFLSAIKTDKYMYVTVLKACISLSNLNRGRQLHEHIICCDLQFDVFVGNTLVDMYAKCGGLEDARRIFDDLPKRDVVSWTVMIAGYAKSGNLEEAHRLLEGSPNRNVVSWGAMIDGYVQHDENVAALECFADMQCENIKPDSLIYTSILKACGNIGVIGQGRCIHEQILESGIQLDVFVGTTLVDMYAKYGGLEEALKVFERSLNRDVAMCSAMIDGYTQRGQGHLAIECYQDMQQEGIKPDRIIFLSILKACASQMAISQGRRIHEQIIGIGLHLDLVICNTLIDMYAKIGNLEEAYKIFIQMSNRDVVSWNAIIACYCQHGKGSIALDYFKEMQQKGIQPNDVTFSTILKACGDIAAIDLGREIHEQVRKRGLESDIFMGTAIVDMYANCGGLETARKMFDLLPNRNVVTWNAMVAAYSQNGDAKLVVQCLKEMQLNGISPDDVTFVGILNACSNAGLVDEGRHFYKAMENYSITPCTLHYNCMIDLLSHSGLFNEAENLIQATVQPNISGWRSLLSACRMHGNMDLGRQCFKEIVRLDSDCAAEYVLISNMYATSSISLKALRN